MQPTRTAARTRLPGQVTANAETQPNAPSLFGFAPGGVYHAAAVTSRAVRSYRTLSPLPRPKAPAVCFLWHFPWGRPRRALPGTVFRGARTFLPHPQSNEMAMAATVQPSGEDKMGASTDLVKQSRQQPHTFIVHDAIDLFRAPMTLKGRRAGPRAGAGNIVAELGQVPVHGARYGTGP